MIQMKMATTQDYEAYADKIPQQFLQYYEKSRTYVMHMLEKQELLGVGSVTMLNESRAKINDIVLFQDDYGLTDGLLRALLNFLDICKIKTVICESVNWFDSLKKLGFVRKEGQMVLALEGFFDKHC